MAPPPRTVELPGGSVDHIAYELRVMADDRAGWVTLIPGVAEEDVPPPRSALGRLFGAQGPVVPVCTWVAPHAKQHPPHIEVGILHATGTKAAKRLADAGVPVPDRWVVLVDHPKRGLVVAVNPEATPVEAAEWLVRAGAALCPVPMTGTWQAQLHLP